MLIEHCISFEVSFVKIKQEMTKISKPKVANPKKIKSCTFSMGIELYRVNLILGADKSQASQRLAALRLLSVSNARTAFINMSFKVKL